MPLLLYCIFRGPVPEIPATLEGVGGYPVSTVTQGGLRAAVSRMPTAVWSPDLPLVQAHGGVVAWLHRQTAVIPLRFGCILADEAEVRRLLAERAAEYDALLEELEGCEEMGIRLLLPEAEATAAGGAQGDIRLEATTTPGPASGLVYLSARRAHYDRLDQQTRRYQQLTAGCRAHFSGLYVRCRTEAASPQRPWLSLYFLVPRLQVGQFRGAFRHLVLSPAAKMVLSGPWPPYNFVVPDRAESWLRLDQGSTAIP